MGKLGHAATVRDLLVYQKACAVADQIFACTKSFPPEEAYSLTDQIRRSSRSVGAQIAEAWAKRRYEKLFVSKLTDADAEQHETRHWVDTADRCNYFDAGRADDLRRELAQIGRMLNGMIEKAELFCAGEASKARESAAEYFVTD